MSRVNRGVAILVSAILAGSLAWAGQAPAQADELSDAKAELSKLQGEASKAAEEYNQVQATLDAAKTKLKQTEQAITDQQAKVEALREQVAIVSLQQFQDRGITSTTVLLTSSSRDDALNNIVVSSMVADTTTQLLQNYQLGQAELADMRRGQQATVTGIAADEARLKALKEKASQKVRDAQALVDRLTEEQRLALLAANAAGLSDSNSDAPSAPRAKPYTPPPPVANGAAAQAIVNFAMARVGLPYVYGGAGPKSYDCSGFTMAAYAKIGIRLPHSASAQFRYGKAVSRADLQPGDLVFYYSGPGHVGIYVGGGMVVDARNERVGVVYRPVTGEMPFVGARRLL